MATSIMQSGNQPVEIPRELLFPKHKMMRAVQTLVVTEMRGKEDRKIRYRINRGVVYRSGELNPVGYYSRKWGQWYPRFTLRSDDEALRQAVAPYVVFV